MLDDVGRVFACISTCWTNILEGKMSISIKFKLLNIGIPNQIYFSFHQLFLLFYIMDSQSGETVKGNYKKCKKKWTDDEVQDLIELLEKKPCLWDIFLKK